MNNIAILTCQKAAKVCTGAGCMRAFNEQTAAFAQYAEPLRLVAFLQCGGCGGPAVDSDMAGKLDRLEKIQTNALHIGVCGETSPGVECATITQVAEAAAARGIAVVRGTHG